MRKLTKGDAGWALTLMLAILWALVALMFTGGDDNKPFSYWKVASHDR